MAKYIKLEDAIATIMSEPPDAHYPSWYADKIKAIPAEDVTQVRHGWWTWNEEGEIDWEQFYRCSNCGDKEYWESNFCPNCGAKMDGGDGNIAMA